VALRTAAGAGQSLAIAKDKSAVQTLRWIQQKLPALITGNGLEDVDEVILHLPFRKADELGHFTG